MSSIMACRRILLIWAIQPSDRPECIRPWITQILNMEERRWILRVYIYITRPTDLRDVASVSVTVGDFHWRPDVDALLGGKCKA